MERTHSLSPKGIAEANLPSGPVSRHRGRYRFGAQETVGGVILEAPFTSVGRMVRDRFHLPIDWLLRTRYDSLSKIHGIGAPIAIVHGTDDPGVPFDSERNCSKPLGNRNFSSPSTVGFTKV